MSYEELKAKYPNLNWKEAEEISNEDLEAASNLFVKILKPEEKLDWPEYFYNKAEQYGKEK